jgi:tRNA (uracil-5-)-methyltransferase TRM9
MMSRVLPWSTVGIDEEELEEGDTLLDWRHAAAGQGSEPGLRYVHLFSREELSMLAESVNARLVSEFESDGRGGNLALYQVWKKI